MVSCWPRTPRPITTVSSPVRMMSASRLSTSVSPNSGAIVARSCPTWLEVTVPGVVVTAWVAASENAVDTTPEMASTMAARPTVAAGLRRMTVNEPFRMSPRPSGRSGMPPGCGAPAVFQLPAP